MSIVLELEKQGFEFKFIGGKILTKPALPPALKEHKDEILSYFQERETIRQAIIRLKLGETDAIRLYSKDCKGEFLITRDESTLARLEGVMSIDIPTFTLKELRELLGADKETVKCVYQVKHAFEGSSVVPPKKKKLGKKITVAVTEVIENE